MKFRSACIFLILLSASWPMRADSSLTKIEDELNEKRKLMGDLDIQKQNFSQALSEFDQATKSLEELRQKTLLEIQKAKIRAENLNALTLAARSRHEMLKEKIQHQMKRHFLSEKIGVTAALVGAETFENYMMRRYAMRKQTENDSQNLQEYRANARAYEEQKQEVDLALVQLAELDGSLKKQADLLYDAQKERRFAIDKIGKNRALVERAAIELEARHQELSQLVRGLASQSKGKNPKHSVENLKGALEWPVKGKIFRRFGQSATSGFSVPAQGMRIRASLGDAVKCVFGGNVVYASWMRGFGRTVIVDHGQGVHSVYAHLDKFAAQLGASIAMGQIIGYVGETESLEGPQLYFEIRLNGMPQDPSIWMR